MNRVSRFDPAAGVAATHDGIDEMSTSEWRGTVVKKYQALPDGSNLHRRILVRLDDGETVKTRVDRATWKALAVGDTVVSTCGWVTKGLGPASLPLVERQLTVRRRNLCAVSG